ncbi:MAG TPA: DUF4392 domain-containing protein [Dehalococcoidia bacterium]|nr:DUF4392 domain-containing protein [Dehalococcoidia bacterium]
MASTTTKPSIEDIILSHDQRGISALRPFLAPSYCTEAARFILNKRSGSGKTALITTGFFILSTQAPETDGPPGAIALANALEQLGFEVIYVTDRYAAPLLTLDGWHRGRERLIEFPIAGHEQSQHFAHNLLAEIKPALIIAIERCGFTAERRYLNMKGKDISAFTAKVDYLFLGQENTLGIGDGGNEIGMGKLAPQIKATPGLPDDPALTPTNHLVISSVSNWGAYGLVAALSQLCQRDLLPSVEWEQELLRELVARGAVDGFTGENKCAVDAFDAEENAWALGQLKKLLEAPSQAKI